MPTTSSSTRFTCCSPTHRCLAPSSPATSACGDRGEALACLVRAQVVVELGHQADQRPARGVPAAELVVGGEPQRRREQDRAGDAGSTLPYLSTRSVPNDQPTSHGIGQAPTGALGDRGRQVEPLAARVVERALAGARRARRAAGVEAQHREVGQRRQPPGRLAQDVAVHHAAVRGQRVQADQGRDRRSRQRQRQLADQRAARRRCAGAAARAGPAARSSRRSDVRSSVAPRAAGDRRSRAAQQAVCQCRRCSTPLASSAGQATTCGVAGRISWSQPGQR